MKRQQRRDRFIQFRRPQGGGGVKAGGGGATRDENGYLLTPTETVASAKDKIETIVTTRAGYDNTGERVMKYQEILLNAPKANARELFDYYTRREKERSREADARNRATAKKIMAGDAKRKGGGISNIIKGIAGRA